MMATARSSHTRMDQAGSTPFEMVTRAVDALGRERLMGVVLNRATEHEHRSNYDYYKYYGPTTTLPAVRG